MRLPLTLVCVLGAFFLLTSPPVISSPPQIYATSPFGHVFIVMEENHSYSSVIGPPDMPYLNSLANQYGLAKNYFANTHPSIGNYFMLTTGQIITNDDNFSGTVTADNIVRQLLAAGKTWKSYAESLPSVGYTGGDVYPYARHHNPFTFFSDVLNSPPQLNNLVPFSQFPIDLANNALPQYSFIVPNLLNDAHDGTLAAADAWLQANIGPLIASPLFQQDGLLVIVFDESFETDTQNGGGQVAMVVVSPKAKSGYQSTTLYQHQSTLRLMAQGLGLSSFPAAAATAAEMCEFFSSTGSGPLICNVAATNISPSAASITWTTNVPATSQVEYGTTTAYGQRTVLDSTLVTGHSQRLTGLTPGTLYHYRVHSLNSGGVETVSGDFTFTAAPLITRVQTATGSSASTTRQSITFPNPVTAGNTLIVGASYGTSTATISDSLGNTWTSAIGPVSCNGWPLQIWYASNVKGGTTTVTVAMPSAAFIGARGHEVSGLATGSALDVTASGCQTSPSTTVTSAALTTTSTPEYLFAIADTGQSTLSAGSGFTLAVPSDSTEGAATEDAIVSSVGTYSASMGISSADVASILLAAFKAPALSRVSLSPSSVIGGTPVTGTVTLSGVAPTGGVVVTLSSSNTAAATVPANVTVAAGATSATFTVSTSAVSSSTSLTISASYGGATLSAPLTVTASLTLSSLTLNPTSVVGGNSSQAIVTLNGPAPSGGAVVTLSSSNTAVATVPANVTVPAGAASATFTVSTSAVTSSTSVTISASYGGATLTASLTVTPSLTLSSLTLNPTSVTGGSSSQSTVTLSGPAPSGGVVVALSSSNTAVATVPANVTVAAGATSATFTVSTSAVTSSTSVTISSSYAGATRTASLTVTPSIARLQTAAGSSGSTTRQSITFPNPVTAGNTLIVGASYGTSTVTISDSLGNTWTSAIGPVNCNGWPLQIWYASNVKGGPTTVTLAMSSATFIGMRGHEVSGLATGSALDVTASGCQTSPSTTITSGALTTTSTREYLFAIADMGQALTLSAGSGFTLAVPSDSTEGAATEDAIVSSVGVYSASMGISSADVATILLAAFKAPALSQISQSSSSVTGRAPVTGTVTPTGVAPTGGVVVTPSSTNTAVATGQRDRAHRGHQRHFHRDH